MEDEICYAELGFPSEPGCMGLQQPVHGSNVSKRLFQYKISLGILGAVCAILGSAVVVLSVFEDATCNLCPSNWREEKGTCYWFSNEKKDWFGGHSDCSGKRAQMLVIQDSEELKFIQASVQEKRFWIGLNFTPSVKSWTWIDGTTADQTLIKLDPQGTGHSCGVINQNEVLTEMCSTDIRWICEKEAIPLKNVTSVVHQV